MAAKARVTASMSALTKFTVTGARDFAPGCAAAGRAATAAACAPSGGGSARPRRATATARRGAATEAGASGHVHPIEMTDSAPWRRPMMFSRLFSAASAPSAATRLAAKAQLRTGPLAAAATAAARPFSVVSCSVAASPPAASPRTSRR